jgi:hypothetical protein
MPASTVPSPGERLLHASADRTVLVRGDGQGPASGEAGASTGAVVVKVYVTGALVDAEREFAMATLAAGPGVVGCRSVGVDAATNRPAITMERLAGDDLRHLVARRGALPAAEACALLAPVASTLARLHALRAAGASQGLCHGDVKPANLVATPAGVVLLDFEHARPIGTAVRGGGTPGFAAPELAAGHATSASAAHDVFALAATLRWLVDGGGARQPIPAALAQLLDACHAAPPERRPSAAVVAQRLRDLATALADDPDERRRDEWMTATFARADGANDPTWRRRRRAATKLAHWFAPSSVPREPAALAAALQRCERLLARFPRHQPTLQQRARLRTAVGEALATAAAEVLARLRRDDAAGAGTFLAGLQSCVAIARRLPDGLPPTTDDPTAIGLLQRDPAAFLQRLQLQLDDDLAELHDQEAAIAAATQRLDLAAADAAIDLLAARHGGSAPVVARLRDRLHRLGFHLDRIARGADAIARLQPLWPTVELAALQEFVALVVRASPTAHAQNRAGDVGLRSLQRTLASLCADFPELSAAAPAQAALTQALHDLSDQAAALLREAQQRLGAIPVPVRPLQLTLGRLDTLRLLEALVDRPQHSRSDLLDGIEALRLALDQARATRDRLAESAEHALARGHWTTGLFDMERAVAGLQPRDDREVAHAERLQERLAAARQRKQEVDGTARRNVDLASTYALLQDDPASTFDKRVQALVERRDALLFLCMHAPSERANIYRRDLRDVETMIALERAAAAEQQLHTTTDPDARLALADTTLQQLGDSATNRDDGAPLPGRLQRLLDHWRALATECRSAVEQRRASAAQKARHRRRVLAIALLAVFATGTALALALRPWLAPAPSYAGERSK